MRAVEQEVNKTGLYAAGFISYEAATGFDAALVTAHRAMFRCCGSVFFGS
ncbi:MAG: hypothetical protein R3F37_09940 [Candidatus Competibacteraceae bacterium]